MTDALSLAAPDWLQFDPADENSRAYFIAAHDGRHHAYRQALARLGRSLQPYDMSGEMNEQWFTDNLNEHMAIRALFPDQIGQITIALEMPQPGADNLTEWMRRHALVHARTDAALGLR